MLRKRGIYGEGLQYVEEWYSEVGRGGEVNAWEDWYSSHSELERDGARCSATMFSATFAFDRRGRILLVTCLAAFFLSFVLSRVLQFALFWRVVLTRDWAGILNFRHLCPLL